MHVPVDLGFSTLVFAVVCLAFPVFTLLIHRKWRLSVARNEEIKKLLVLASEEAARVEFEATVSYSAVPVSSNVYQCAVCYCPTTTRCAQCKSVRYCSGKCQIVHWRQGHKYECRRPTGFNDYGTDFGEEMAVKNGLDIYDASWENAPTDCASSDSSWSPELAPKPEHDARGDFISEASGMDSVSESSGTFFSGFSSTVSSGESSDEASGCESISSNEPEGPDGQSSTDVAPDVLRFSVKKKDRSESISPKFAKLADSSNNASDMTILNEFKPLGGKASNSSGPSISATFSKTNSVKVASNNCGIASESVPTILEDVNAESNTVKSVKTKLSEAEPKLHFKFNMSRTDALSSHKQRAEATSIIFEEAPSKKAAPGDFNVDVSRSFKSGNSESSTLKESDSCGKSTFSMDHEHRAGSMSSSQCASSNGGDISKVSGSTISNSNKLNLVANGTLTASQSWKLRPSSDASGCNSSSTNGRLLPNVKDVNVEDAEGSRIACNQSGSASCASSNSMGGLRSSMRKVVDQLRGAKSGRYSHKGLFPYDVFVKLYSNKVELQPCGLINCGNSCYANVVLQCLLFTPPLTAYFVLGFHSKSCATKHWCFICELENLVLKAKEGRTPLSPISILSQLQSIGSNLGNGREEDAHEFLRYAIEAMHSGCLKEAGIKAVGSVEDETTLIGLTFGGYLRSKIKCMKCHYKSERQERMMDLTVEIEGDIEKLEDALRQFTSTEILDGENKYQCSRCKSYEKAKKKLTILKAPNILTIALKRFQSGKFGKLNKPIQFPEILDLAPYMSGTSDKSPIYRLYAVIVHLDIMNASFSGHYVCYVKNSQNKWFKIDDSMVTAVELERVLTKGAYMLLYARCSPQASGLMRNGTVTPDMKTKCTASRIHPKGPSPSSASTHSSGAESQPNSVSQDNADSVESFYLKFHRLRRILEEDSSSDNYSFSSSNSDEGSCSTDSTRDSMSADDLSDYIFGGWNSSMKKAADSDACSSSSSSPLYSRHSPLSNTNRNAPGFAVMSGSWSRDGYPSSRMEHGDVWDNREANMEGGEHRFYHVKQDNNNKKKNNNNSKNCRSLGSSSSCREVEESERFGLGSNKSSSSTSTSSDVKYGVAAFRRSVSERTD